jgi:hypothetical protein
MKTFALTVRQPFAWLIAEGHKQIENRTWCPSYRGALLIHASKAPPDEDDIADAEDKLGAVIPRHRLALGAIVGVVTLAGVVERSRSRWFTGPYGWRLEDARRFAKPVECRGRLSLWVPPRRVLAQLR